MNEARTKSVSTETRRFKRHPAYKDSGVEWLGKIPAHWEVKRLKTLISDPITDGPHETPEFLTDGVPFLSVDGIQEGELVFEGCRYISEADHRDYRRKCAPRRDDILLGKAASTGKIARVKVDFEFSVWSPLALIRPNDGEVWPGFLEYALKSTATQAQIDVLCTSNTQKNISMQDIPTLVVCIAAFQEQRTIAAFLDRETARIDALVVKKERLIELLQEQRTALITRAVTKGLDPNVRMKDSGVEWLGKIPAHWEITPLRWALSVRSGEALPNTDFDLTASVDRRLPVIGGNGVMGYGDRSNTTAACIAVGRVGALCGNVHLVDPPAWITDNALVLSEIKGFDRKYLALLLEALNLNRWASQNAQPLITGEFVKAQQLCRPPSKEQVRIVERLGSETAAIDVLINRVRGAIDYLKEFRIALISAAVTGRIDVREEVV